MAFKPIKNQLKRDLEKWEETKKKRSESGKAGGLRSGEVRKQNEANEANASNFKQNEANEAVNDNVIICNNVLDVNANETVNANDILLKKETKNDLIYFELSVSEQWLERTAMQTNKKLTIEMVKEFLKSYNEMINVQFDFKNNKTEYCTHFINWLNKQEKPVEKNNHPARNKIIQ